jgi:N-acetylglucosamine-6-sulfatase
MASITRRDILRIASATGAAAALPPLPAQAETIDETLPSNAPKTNIVYILIDDLRHDCLSIAGHPYVETPNIDRLGKEGIWARNACVTTALCSPSRCSTLTGMYAHKHRVVDNNNPVSKDLVFFPQLLQKKGYKTAFFGKWHMGGDSDAPQRGFDHWVSFRGQGTYMPNPGGLNVNGTKVPQKGYITDELTDYTIGWLESLPKDQPFFAYVSHKAVHSNFVPAERHKGRYAGKSIPTPVSQAKDIDPQGRPRWVSDQRSSHHGVDFPYHGQLDVQEYHRRYCETLLAVDDSVGRILAALDTKGILDNTLVVFMGDNGFAFGEHGLIDKRTAYEESMRVPLLMRCPSLFAAGTALPQVVANIDLGPTFLDIAGVKAPSNMDGRSYLPLLQGKPGVTWRDGVLYEYYWERNFPHTPTVHALRTEEWKYIRVQGLWDLDELYNLKNDPLETKNLIRDPKHRQVAAKMNTQLFQMLQQTGGMQIPLLPDMGGQADLRAPGDKRAADFPDAFIAKEAKPLA